MAKSTTLDGKNSRGEYAIELAKEIAKKNKPDKKKAEKSKKKGK